MAHIYMTFDFGADEEKAQLARHKLEGWKQAFRLDKKLLYKFERPQDEEAAKAAGPDSVEKPEVAKAKGSPKAAKSAKAKKDRAADAKSAKTEEAKPAPTTAGPVKLHVRLAFSGHEKMTEDRWLKRIPSEEPFREASSHTVKANDVGFGEVESQFELLE